MSTLKTLEDHQDLILLAEIGALIHDLGKLSAEFVRAKAGVGDDIHHLFLKRYLPKVPDSLQGHSSKQNRVETALKYLNSVDTDQAQALRTYLEAEYQANPKLDLGGALRAYRKEHPTAAELISQVEAVVEEHKKLSKSGELVLAERQAQIPAGFIPDTLLALLNSFALPAYPDENASLLPETVIGELIEGHHSPPAPWRVAKSGYLALLRAREGGTDGFDSWIDKGQVDRQPSQLLAETLIATAFGHEAQRIPVGPDEDGLKPIRDRFAEVLAEELGKVRDGKAKPADVRPRILKEAEDVFRQALGETRRAANDVTLWDHSYSVASLYKAALAKVLLERAIVGEEYKFPEPAHIGWRFLRVGVNGLQFFAQAHHVTDMLGRQQALMEALDQVRQVLEVEFPLGNEVYRDENGSIFVIPGLDDERHRPFAREVEERVLEAFRRTGLSGELMPQLIWNDEGPVRKEMITSFGSLVTQPPSPPTPEAQTMREWWENTLAQEKEVCTVCAVRPVGYIAPGLDKWVTSRKAGDRNVCGVCLQRRGHRARAWARNERTPDERLGPFERTIWTDEVADNNGRLALVVGRFVLDDWLNGKLVATMLVASGISKNPSPARIRRIWETTRRFWLEVQDDPIPANVGERGERHRWAIRPANAHRLNDPRPDKGLGKWHAYETELAGHRLSLCWDPNDGEAQDRDLLWTTDNLDYFAKLAGMEVGKLEEHIRGRRLQLYEPGGYLGQERRLEVDAEGCRVERKVAFRPYIPLLAEPAIFMALVPANIALEVAQAIKAKYDQEMARVRDRLPLHLGLVFAHRRTPLAAILEAGRAMLELPARWEEWQIQTTGRKAVFSQNGRTLEWDYPAKMGDSETDDVWYAHLLTVDPTTKEILGKDAGDFHPVGDFSGTVFIHSSRIDFEFLDTTARRFEIVYDDQGRRRSPNKRNRPYLLDDLERLETLWNELRYLEKSQRHQVIATIEATREAWFGDDREGKSLTDQPFRQFVHDTLAGAAWPKDHRWKTIPDQRREELIAAGVRGELADLTELHRQILKE